MRPEARTLTIGCLAAVLCTSTLSAQEATVAPFHRGQWGVDVGISNGFYGVGLVRFRSPTRAWVFDVSADIVNSKDTTQFTGQQTSVQQVTLQVGSRSYHPMGARVYRTLTFGVSGSYAHNHNEQGGIVSTGSTLGTGLFGELGAQWMVTPHLSLGATWFVSGRYSHSSTNSNNSVIDKRDTFELSLGGIGLRGAFYF